MFNLVKKKTLTGTRTLEGSYVNGRWVEGGVESLSFKANVQPMTYEELQRLPEGLRDKDVIIVMTKFELRTVNQINNTNPDNILWQGRTYQVQKVSAFQMGVQDHYEVYAMRVEEVV
jgi:hypothetical protein